MKSHIIITSLLLCASLAALRAEKVEAAHHWTSHRADGHAPIGVMADHTHHAGEWMLSYRYHWMEMDGMRAGTDDLDRQGVYQRGFMVSPIDMEMHMHMLGIMVAPTDWLTLMAMGGYVEKEMLHATRPGSMARMMRGKTFTAESDGFSDTRISGLIKVLDRQRMRLHLEMGLSIPTGSIDESAGTTLPYPMQIGSGTWDWIPGITYLGQSDFLSWGAQARGAVRLHDNDADYHLGHRLDTTLWGAFSPRTWVSVSARLAHTLQGKIEGSDDRIAPGMSPLQDPANSGREILNLGVGLNLYLSEGRWQGHRIALEWLTPLYEDVTGLQMATESGIVVGWQYAF